MPVPNYDITLFDLDGTLADTLPLIYEAFDAAFLPVLGSGFSQAEIRAMFGPPDHEIIRRRVPETAADDAIARYNRHYEGRHDELVEAFDGISDLIRKCAGAGIRMGVITGKSRLTALITLDRLKLRAQLPVVYAGDDVQHQKPAPDAPLLALRDLNAVPGDRAVMIGDSAADVIAGRNAGIATIGVSWGSPDLDELAASGPDHTVSTVAELEALLLR